MPDLTKASPGLSIKVEGTGTSKGPIVNEDQMYYNEIIAKIKIGNYDFSKVRITALDVLSSLLNCSKFISATNFSILMIEFLISFKYSTKLLRIYNLFKDLLL